MGAGAGDPAFPHLSGLNWPSYLLQALLTLRALGVPEQNVRLIPTSGHFAQPEVLDSGESGDDPDEGMADAAPWEMRHPRGPHYDSASGRLTIQRVSDPTELYPRLEINVRSDTAAEDRAAEMPVGRLAHFLDILMADPPGTLPPGEAGQQPGESPLEKLTRQVAALSPELTEVMPERVRSRLRTFLSALEAALRVPADDPARGETLLKRTLETLKPSPEWATVGFAPPKGSWLLEEIEPVQAAFRYLIPRVAAAITRSEPGQDPPFSLREAAVALGRLEQWADLMTVVAAATGAPEQQRQAYAWFAEVREAPGIASGQAQLVYEMQRALGFETPRERLRVIRHLLEILTTEAFMATAAIDHLWGIAWLHGPLRDFGQTTSPLGKDPADPEAEDDTLLLSVTGGQHPHSLLLTLIRDWAGDLAQRGSRVGFLGVRVEALAEAGFSAEEQDEIWALATWRRQTADPLTLFEISVQRLVHPQVRTRMRRYSPKAGRYNTLWAQPGRTAVLGGKTRLFSPSLEIWLPFAEDSDHEAHRAGLRIRLLASLFVPITLPLHLVWQEAVARLGGSSDAQSDQGEAGGSYLRHPLQSGVRLAGTGIIKQNGAASGSEGG
ncbi:MAG: hypothetical protein H7Z41_13635 [Cytophagales bacterium]|nr:hypothetical protein [Armatimonadota bacterium]